MALKSFIRQKTYFVAICYHADFTINNTFFYAHIVYPGDFVRSWLIEMYLRPSVVLKFSLILEFWISDLLRPHHFWTYASKLTTVVNSVLTFMINGTTSILKS